MILADVTIKGARRKALVHFDKNGFAYTMDRATGEVLVAEPYVSRTGPGGSIWPPAGRCSTRTKLTGASRGTAKYICPSLEGGKSPASPAAYSPHTGLFYLVHRQPLHGLLRPSTHRASGARRTSAPARPTRPAPAATSARSSRGTPPTRQAGLGDQGEVSRLERRVATGR